jgi:serine/threonine protein kinase/formylglycine-generating enzyme required for sulfatase activity
LADPEKSPRPATPGLPFEPESGRFEPRHVVLRGAAITLAKAVDRKGGATVAIVRPTGAAAADPESLARFATQAKVVADLSQPNALPIRHLAQDAQGPYAVTDWPTRGTLEQRLLEGPLDSEPLLALAQGIAAGLAAALPHGLAHGRVLASEIFLFADDADEPRPALGAFGIGLPDDAASTMFVADDSTEAPARRREPSAADDARQLCLLLERAWRGDSKSDSRPPPPWLRALLERGLRGGFRDALELREALAVTEAAAPHSATGRGSPATAAGKAPEFPWRPLAEQYRIDGKPMEGGMGSVCRAIEIATGRIVAVKRVKRADPETAQRFHREAASIARLNHPHVLQLMQAARDDEGDYLVLEWAPNGSLADLLERKGPLRESEVAAIATKIGAALEYAHSKGCIHRDIKPHNILLSETGEPKLSDFGLARGLDDLTLTTSGAGAGSPVYMPPEQWQDSKRADARSDVYAFAKTLYHLLTGEKPATIDKQKISPPLLAVLKRATQQDADDRYATVGAFVADFQEALAPAAAKPTRGGRASLYATLALLVIGGVAVFTVPGLRERVGLDDAADSPRPPITPAPPNEDPRDENRVDPPRESQSETDRELPSNEREEAPPPAIDVTPPPARKLEEFLARPLADLADVNAALALLPHYAGLTLREHGGLTPLRIDPLSKLVEFHHAASGAAPLFQGNGAYAITPETGIVLVLIPGGRTAMGAQKRDPGSANFDPDAADDEAPVHEIELAPYFIGKYEVTQAQWERLAGNNPSAAQGAQDGVGKHFAPQSPVENVSHREAVAVLARHGLVLPTEAQWERAARGDRGSPWFCGEKASLLERYANLADQLTRKTNADKLPWMEDDDWAPFPDSHANTAPVHEYAANPFGLHGVAGNVAEWCADVKVAYGEPARQGDGLRGAGATGPRVARGGSYAFGPFEARSARRQSAADDVARPFLGLRAARPLDP